MTQNVATDPEVLIIGGGPVGMVSASELTRYGIRCRVVDKRPGPIDVTHACVLWPRTQEVLAAMGIRDLWVPHAMELHQMSMYGFGKRLGTVHYEGLDSPYPTPFLVGQNITERLLIQHLESVGVSVERPVEATHFEQDQNGVTVTLHHADGNEETVHARWLIDCEGSKSMVRETLGIPFEGERYTNYEFVQADCAIRWSRPKGAGYYFLSDKNFMATLPLPLPMEENDRIRVFIAQPITDASNRSDPTLDEIQALMREVAAEDVELSHPFWLSRVRVQRRLAARFHEGRTFLAGDSGHVHVPMGGQGMNTGMQDAFNLAWKLASVIKGNAQETLLDSYNNERHPVAESLLKGTDLTFRNFSEPSALLQSAVQLLGPVAFSLDLIQSRVVTTLSELDINYKKSSPIAEDHRTGSGIIAGERALDAPVVTLPTKETQTLFEIFRGTHWTLLLFSGHEATAQTLQQLTELGDTLSTVYGSSITSHLVLAKVAPPRSLTWSGSILMDSERFVHEKYGVSAASLYLVRPDGYVGFRGPLATAKNLRAYLERILLQPVASA